MDPPLLLSMETLPLAPSIVDDVDESTLLMPRLKSKDALEAVGEPFSDVRSVKLLLSLYGDVCPPEGFLTATKDDLTGGFFLITA